MERDWWGGCVCAGGLGWHHRGVPPAAPGAAQHAGAGQPCTFSTEMSRAVCFLGRGVSVPGAGPGIKGVGEGYCQPAGSRVGVLGARQRSERPAGCKRGSKGRGEAGDDGRGHWLSAEMAQRPCIHTLHRPCRALCHLTPTRDKDSLLDHTTVRLLGALLLTRP